MTTVAAVIIGDEILSGKVADTNLPLLINLCRERGADLLRVSIIGDEVEGIVDEIRRSSALADVVITSGGLGPTHDDRTVEAVARAFDRPVVRNEEIAAMIRTFWADRFTEAALRMADMPEGSRLIEGGDGLLPLVATENVYMLPGVPKLFEGKIATIRQALDMTPSAAVNVYLQSDESRIAPLITEVNERHADVKIGSYPRFGQRTDHRLWICFEAADRNVACAAADDLVKQLPPEDVVRVE
jgi:molybdenum cofactor synthesis domain-containing protein